MKDITCRMELYEYPDMKDGWLCSNCSTPFYDSAAACKRAEKNGCPCCGAKVVEWEDLSED